MASILMLPLSPVFVMVFLYDIALSSTIEPIITNSSGEYYIISPEETTGNQSITCSSLNCHVLCGEPLSCMDLEISAYDAISLTVECPSNRSCIDTNIICPKPNASSTDSFCDISCGDDLSCANTVIELHAINSFNLSCNAYQSCTNADVSLSDGSSIKMGHVSVQCTDNASCQNMTWSSEIVLDTIDMQCTGDKSCQFMTFEKALHLNNISMQCIGDKSCQYMFLKSVEIDSYLNIHCGANLACYKIETEFTSIKPDQNIITCDNPTKSSNATGSCYQSRFSFQSSYNDKHSGNINISCNAFDCQNIWIEIDYGYPMHQLSLYCNDAYSCHNAWFNGEALSLFDVHCKGTKACYKTTVSCPTHTVNACNIYCTDGDDVCTSFGVETAYKYTPGAVNVFCDSEDQCYGLYFECDDYYDYHSRKTLVKNNTFLKYNDAEDAQCVVNKTVVSSDDSYCCPLIAKDAKDSKTPNKAWFIAVGVLVVILLVIVCVLSVFAVKKRSDSKRSPALLEENEQAVIVEEEVEDDVKQGSYEPPKEDTEMTQTSAT